CQKYSSPPFTF
nr:immunoglobulin light chain junction region [Macaca mulatta]MOV85517.1 immunoglobulin light chain junction region [Macaca mulatta]MOV86092.1 immunoglobulin light chain junction region [Macaca mulatta]MOX99904.1 immunoglobulin light chain junction region [Macaca mulatta]MOY00185.1 immunoglobulin light chain junction region [Macaca mulatta]